MPPQNRRTEACFCAITEINTANSLHKRCASNPIRSTTATGVNEPSMSTKTHFYVQNDFSVVHRVEFQTGGRWNTLTKF
jgi:hypothetical protein